LLFVSLIFVLLFLILWGSISAYIRTATKDTNRIRNTKSVIS
jgi:hypothetical protein